MLPWVVIAVGSGRAQAGASCRCCPECRVAPCSRSIVNHPGFGRDSLLGSGDQADQVAQLVQGLELDRWPALAGSVQSTVVVPIHPCRSGDVDLSYIVPWPAWFNQLGLVQTYQ